MIGIHNYPLFLQYLLEQPEFTDEQLQLINWTREKLLKKPENKEEIENHLERLMDWGEESSEFVLYAGRGRDDYWANEYGIHST